MIDITPLQIRLTNDYEVVVAGLKAMLAPFSDRIEVVDTEVGGLVGRQQPVDLTLYDTFGRAQSNQDDLAAILADTRSGKVVVYSWNTHEHLVAEALAKGVTGYLSKSLGAPELVDSLVRIAGGAVVVPAGVPDREPVPNPSAPNSPVPNSPAEDIGSWPGKREGLSVREAEVIALITQGYTNPEIADRIYVTVNSLKSYIRSAYRKMGVERRSQAVRWGIAHGMLPPDHQS
ncbi:response regulator transcription factor [Leucobacter denitrificans]|uniref:response regulator transcription factor n=1 Tax=Leucobacter denitrificans TaxID=683042 RepID=UPI001FE47403|nr:response regulator transcription factor [Leucobacter denitrificans]